MLVLQPGAPQSVPLTKPDLSALHSCELLPLHWRCPAEQTSHFLAPALHNVEDWQVVLVWDWPSALHLLSVAPVHQYELAEH